MKNDFIELIFFILQVIIAATLTHLTCEGIMKLIVWIYEKI